MRGLRRSRGLLSSLCVLVRCQPVQEEISQPVPHSHLFGSSRASQVWGILGDFREESQGPPT